MSVGQQLDIRIQAHSNDNTGKRRESDPSIRKRRFQPLRCAIEVARIFASAKAITVKQGSPIFLKLRATSCVKINAKSYQCDTHFWNKNVAQFSFNYFSINN